MENRIEYLECYCGIPSARLGLAHLNYRLHPRELIHIVNDCGASALIVEEAFSDTVAEIRKRVPDPRHT